MHRRTKELLFVAIGLILLLVANVVTPWENANIFTLICAIAGLIFLNYSAEERGKREIENLYGRDTRKRETND